MNRRMLVVKFVFLCLVINGCKSFFPKNQCRLREKVIKKVFMDKKISKYSNSNSNLSWPFLGQMDKCNYGNIYFHSIASAEIEILPNELSSYYLRVAQYSQNNEGDFPHNYNFIKELKYEVKNDTISIEWFYPFGNLDIHAELIKNPNDEVDIVYISTYIIN